MSRIREFLAKVAQENPRDEISCAKQFNTIVTDKVLFQPLHHLLISGFSSPLFGHYIRLQSASLHIDVVHDKINSRVEFGDLAFQPLNAFFYTRFVRDHRGGMCFQLKRANRNHHRGRHRRTFKQQIASIFDPRYRTLQKRRAAKSTTRFVYSDYYQKDADELKSAGEPADVIFNPADDPCYLRDIEKESRKNERCPKMKKWMPRLLQ